MAFIKTWLFFFILFLLALFNSPVVKAQHLHLKVAGDKQNGFRVDIYSGNQMLLTNTEEFSLQMFNNDLSTVANMDQWKGQSWTGDERKIILQRDSYINEFDANLSVTISYEVMSNNISIASLRCIVL